MPECDRSIQRPLVASAHPRRGGDRRRGAILSKRRIAKTYPARDGGWSDAYKGVSKMSTLAFLQSLKESILSQASVKAIYGEPISAHGKTRSEEHTSELQSPM